MLITAPSFLLCRISDHDIMKRIISIRPTHCSFLHRLSVYPPILSSSTPSSGVYFSETRFSCVCRVYVLVSKTGLIKEKFATNYGHRTIETLLSAHFFLLCYRRQYRLFYCYTLLQLVSYPSHLIELALLFCCFDPHKLTK